MTTIADKLQLTLSTKNAIKQALIDKGADVGAVPFASYPALIGGLSSGGFPIGTVADWKLDQSSEGWLPLDGSLVSEADWPLLKPLLPNSDGYYDWPGVGLTGLPDFGTLIALVKFSPNGQFLALATSSSSAGQSYKVIRTSDWAEINVPAFSLGFISALEFSPDSQWLAVGGSAGAHLAVIDLSAGSLVPNTPSISSDVKALVFTNDSQQLIVGAQNSPRIQVFNTQDWSQVAGVPDVNGSVMDFSLTPDGQQLAIVHWYAPFFVVLNTSDWSLQSGTPSLPLTGNTHAQCCDYSPDGSYVVVGIYTSPYLLKIDAYDWSITSPISLSGSVSSAAHSPEGDYLVLPIASSGGVVIDTYAWEVFADLPIGTDQMRGASFSPSKEYLALALSRGSGSGLVVLNIFTLAPEGFFYLPTLESITYGNVTVQPMIKGE
ncbi:WD40 repeat domain-containing protein [Halomonas sp. 7T]|uniref:WD40 repeat domain-containing protein n=1 Tax=Halomonas sp. 7T TaxID=2893469 RepID=UPI0021D8B2CC|nr:WD40 repeat domain-containing protein [Halomonas sp. 7T]UXZ55836.1 WD40 repeat domain-containing protein [Halomonas sp. 7T]